MTPGAVKLRESSGKAGGFPIGLTVGGVVAGVFALYWPALSYGIVDYDDPIFVQNRWVQPGLTWDGLKWAFTNVEYFYVPLTWLSLMLDCAVYGPGPAGFHLTNLLLHEINVLTLFFLCWRLTRRLWFSGLVAALFAVHPLNVEAVAWIAERKGLLGALFCLLCVHSYVSYRARPGIGRYLAFTTLSVMSLLAKPMALTLPVLLVVLDVLLLRHAGAEGNECNLGNRGFLKRLGILFVEQTPLLLAGLIMAAMTFKAENKVGALSLDPSQSAGYKIEKVITSYWQYVANGFWPTNLSVLYPLPEAFSRWRTGGSVAFFVALATLIIVKRDRWSMFGLAWYLILLLPVSGIVQLGVQYAPDRYAYLPLVGLFIIVAHVVSQRRQPVVTGCGCLLALGLLANQSSRQIETWRETLTLFDHAVQVTKGNFVALNNVAWILATDPRYNRSPVEQQRALSYAQEACRLTKYNDDRLLETLAVCLVHVGNRMQAREELLQAAMVAERHGRHKMAAGYLKEASAYPASPDERNNRQEQHNTAQ